MTRKSFAEFAVGGISLRFSPRVELSAGRYDDGQLFVPDMDIACRDGVYAGA